MNELLNRTVLHDWHDLIKTVRRVAGAMGV